jgi:hypothetical protein
VQVLTHSGNVLMNELAQKNIRNFSSDILCKHENRLQLKGCD